MQIAIAIQFPAQSIQWHAKRAKAGGSSWHSASTSSGPNAKTWTKSTLQSLRDKCVSWPKPGHYNENCFAGGKPILFSRFAFHIFCSRAKIAVCSCSDAWLFTLGEQKVDGGDETHLFPALRISSLLKIFPEFQDSIAFFFLPPRNPARSNRENGRALIFTSHCTHFALLNLSLAAGTKCKWE